MDCEYIDERAPPSAKTFYRTREDSAHVIEALSSNESRETL